MTLLYVALVTVLVAICGLFVLLCAVTNSITKVVDRTRERVTNLENSAKEMARQLWELKHPTCKCEACVAKRKQKVDHGESATFGTNFPTEFAKRVSALYRTKHTGEDMDG